MPVTTILHKGKRVVYIDYSNLKTEEEAMKTLYEVRDYLVNSPTKVLKLNNVTNAFASTQFMNETKKLSKEILDEKTEKGAIIGISRIQKILLRSVNIFLKEKLKPFDTMEEALDYLAA